MSEDRDNDAPDKVGRLIETGSDLTGALAGAALGMVGGPVGAIGGAALGVVVQRAVAAIGECLSKREQERVGTTITLILQEDAERAGRNEQLRDDGFFDKRDDLRSDGDEVLEALLRQAAATYEERKLPSLAHLYTRIAYDNGITGATGIFLLRIADQLTYRQLTILALAAARDAGRRTGEDNYFQLTVTSLLDRERRGRKDVAIAAGRASLVDLDLLQEGRWPERIGPHAVGPAHRRRDGTLRHRVRRHRETHRRGRGGHLNRLASPPGDVAPATAGPSGALLAVVAET